MHKMGVSKPLQATLILWTLTVRRTILASFPSTPRPSGYTLCVEKTGSGLFYQFRPRGCLKMVEDRTGIVRACVTSVGGCYANRWTVFVWLSIDHWLADTNRYQLTNFIDWHGLIDCFSIIDYFDYPEERWDRLNWPTSLMPSPRRSCALIDCQLTCWFFMKVDEGCLLFGLSWW